MGLILEWEFEHDENEGSSSDEFVAELKKFRRRLKLALHTACE